MNIKDKFLEFEEYLSNNTSRTELQYITVYYILCAITLVMGMTNFLTGHTFLAGVDFVFSLSVLFNILLTRRSRKYYRFASIKFIIEIMILLTFLAFSGRPDGFGIIWFAIVPFCMIIVYGRKQGSIYNLIAFIILLISLWTPFGESMHERIYNDTFKIHFPLVFLTSYLVAFFLETIRTGIYNKLKKSEYKYEYLCRHDYLTDVYNRYGLNKYLSTKEGFVAPKGIALLLVDIDLFKFINDQKGHKTGDAALQELAKLLKEFFRDNAVICRWGGEEFVVMLEDVECAQEKAVNFRKLVERHEFIFKGNSLRMTISIGVTTSEKNAIPDFEKLFSIADQNLYSAKRAGRNCVFLSALSHAEQGLPPIGLYGAQVKHAS